MDTDHVHFYFRILQKFSQVETLGLIAHKYPQRVFLLLIANIDQQSTMGSSRRFGTSSELKLQKMLRQQDSRFDASQIASPNAGDRSTRFDYETPRNDYIRQEIDKKQEVCFNLLN
jgi:hypothetical protein